jgi:ribonuclease R
MIKAIINQQGTLQCSDSYLASIQQAQDNAYQARSQMEQWLKCDYLKPLQGKNFSGIVTQVNSNGFTVRLDELHVEGFIETKLLGEKFSFDPMRLRLKSKNQEIQLEQSIEVSIKEVDSQRRSIRFTLPKVTAEPVAKTEQASTAS